MELEKLKGLIVIFGSENGKDLNHFSNFDLLKFIHHKAQEALEKEEIIVIEFINHWDKERWSYSTTDKAFLVYDLKTNTIIKNRFNLTKEHIYNLLENIYPKGE